MRFERAMKGCPLFPRGEAIPGGIIQLEIKIGALYRLLWRLFPEEETLLAALCAKQEFHALVMNAAEGNLFEESIFSGWERDPDEENIRRAIEMIDETITEYQCVKPARGKALTLARAIELSTGELYRTLAAKVPGNSPAFYFSREIIEEKKNHADTIQGMIDRHTILLSNRSRLHNVKEMIRSRRYRRSLTAHGAALRSSPFLFKWVFLAWKYYNFIR